MGSNSAIFFDRDGTLNQEIDYLSRPDQLILVEGAVEAVRLVNHLRRLALVITNQSGIARGYFTEKRLMAIHLHLSKLFADEGARLDGIYYCPHHPSEGELPYRVDCDCRKPKSQLLERAARDFDLDLPHCAVIGDRLSDVEMAHRVGALGILVLTGYGRSEAAKLTIPDITKPDHIAANVLEAVKWVLANELNP
jgi:D-glycero-D-manno-heptose 1,7-bisphosphate phosphatase